MRRPVVPFLTACVLAAGAGVAIGGLPTRASRDALVVQTPRTTAPPATVPRPPATTRAPASEPPTTTSVATSVAASVPTTEPPATTSPPTTAPTSVPTTEPPATTTEPALASGRGRDELEIAVANAAGVSGVAARGADHLRTLGYTDLFTVDAVDPRPHSALFHEPGLELEALRLKDDLAWHLLDVATMDQLPELATDSRFEMVLVLGIDHDAMPTSTPEP